MNKLNLEPRDIMIAGPHTFLTAAGAAKAKAAGMTVQEAIVYILKQGHEVEVIDEVITVDPDDCGGE